MANNTIEDIVEQIRHAVYGRDVRENIAQGIEKCYEDVGGNVLHNSDIANNLTQTEAGKVLDARQGKILNDKFGNYVQTANIANNLTQTEAGKVLDARQGKILNDKFGNCVSSDPLKVLPDQYENMVNPVNATFSGMKWDNGILVNDNVDSKNNIQIYVQTINSSGSATTHGAAITESGSVKRAVYLTPSTKYLQIRHNGSSRDLYARFAINIEIGGEFIITFNIIEGSPNTINGIKISSISMVKYAANVYSASISELHHLVIPEDRLPVFTKSSSTITTKFINMTEASVFTNAPDTEKTMSPSQIVTDIPNYATYENNELTIQIPSSMALIYDYENNKMLVTYVSSGSIPKRNCVVLVYNWYGNIYGDWVNHSTYRSEFLNPAPYIGDTLAFTYINRMNGSVDVYLQSSLHFIDFNGNVVSITKEMIVSQLGSSAVMDGSNVKITLTFNHGLFYNVSTKSLFIDVAGLSGQGIMRLLYTSWGSLSGELLTFYFRNKIENHDTHLGRIDSIIELPSYYEDEVNDTVNKLAKLPSDNFNYLLLTDIHYSYPNEFTSVKLKQLMDTVDKIGNGSNIDAVICLGDIIEGGSTANRTESDNQLNAVFEGFRGIRKPVLFAFGNHDNNLYDFSSASESYKNTDHYIVMNEWKNKAVLPFGINSDHYCMDFTKKNMRVIVANTSDYQESVDSSGNVSIANYSEIMIRKNQLDDIADMMNESQYDMVVFAHAIVNGLLSLISKYNSRETYTKENGTVINFSGKTKKVLLYHTGHYHNNAMEYISGYNINLISTSCASMATAQQSLSSSTPPTIVPHWEDTPPVAWNSRVIPRIKNTANETCYDVVSIGSGKINKIGFGASSDKTLTIK